MAESMRFIGFIAVAVDGLRHIDCGKSKLVTIDTCRFAPHKQPFHGIFIEIRSGWPKKQTRQFTLLRSIGYAIFKSLCVHVSNGLCTLFNDAVCPALKCCILQPMLIAMSIQFMRFGYNFRLSAFNRSHTHPHTQARAIPNFSPINPKCYKANIEQMFDLSIRV